MCLDAIWIIFLIYFTVYYLGNFLLNTVAVVSVYRYMRLRGTEVLPESYTDFEPPISIIVPSYNEENTIAGSLRSLLQLSYSEYEIVVVNDGSTDRTLEVLIREFSLVQFPEAYRVRINTKPLLTVYRSSVYPNLRVLDKVNGGKADSINAGINASRYPLFCVIDADSVLIRDSLKRVVEPFLEDPTTVASGGTVRIINGCKVSGGHLVDVGLPRNFLVLFQIVEYLRAFLLGRIGWCPMNALLIISGAFGLFRKDAIIEVGGFRTDTVGEDMELIVRLHRHMRLKGKPYRIVNVPDPICWTEAPEDIRTLKKQRMRWQRGLSETLTMNMSLLFNPRGGTVSWIAFPFYVIFEWLGPVIEVGGYVITIGAFFMGFLSAHAMSAFFVVAVGFGIFLSVSTLLMEGISFHIYPGLRHLLLLVIMAFVENLGYRQMNSLWRLAGLISWAFGLEKGWQKGNRKATWQQN